MKSALRQVLTPALVKQADGKGSRLEIQDEIVRGFALRVSRDGKKAWTIRYRLGGRDSRRRRMVIGFPEKLPLGAAREEARRLLARVQLGEDPQAERIAKRQQAEGDGRSATWLVEQMVAAIPMRPATRVEWARLAKKELSGEPFNKPLGVLRRAEVRLWMEQRAKRSVYTAHRAFEVLRRAYSWGIEHELVETSPCDHVRKVGVEARSERVLSRTEIRALQTALDALPGGCSDIVRLLLLTGARRGMAIGALASEFEDLNGREPRWVVPGGAYGRSKSGRAHLIPLSPPAVDLVRRRLELGTPALFPGDKLGKPMRYWPGTYLKDLKIGVEAARKKLLEKIQGAPLTEAEAEMPRWRIHDLRHTVATHLREDLHVSVDVVSAILGHTRPGIAVTRIYDRSELMGERRAALVAWAAWLDEVAKEEQRSAKILPLAR
jgi:integrase